MASQFKSKQLNVKIKVPPQADGKRVDIEVLPKNPGPAAAAFFKRVIINFHVRKEEDGNWVPKKNFNPPLELKVGYEPGDDQSWELYYEEFNPPNRIIPFAAYNYGYVNRALFRGKPGKHAYVYLHTWGDPNVGWG